MSLILHTSYLILFTLGLCVGSFLNVVIDRLPKGEQIFKGRSYCDFCRTPLPRYDLIPLFSWLYLSGKCRFCGARISAYYPLVEFITGLAFVGVWLLGVNRPLMPLMPLMPLTLLILLTLVSALIVVFFTDLKYGIIPDKIVIPAIVILITYHLSPITYRLYSLYSSLKFNPFGRYLLQTDYFKVHAWLMVRPFLLTLFSSFFLFTFFFFLHILFRGRAMGLGDAKLSFLIGLLTGFPKMFLAIFLSFLTGAIVAVILIMAKRKKFGETIPFGPFLVMGTLLTMFFGDEILSWYLGLF